MNKLIRKTLLVFVLIFIVLFITSCTGEEIDTLGIVIALGFDIEDGEVVITNEIINPIGLASKTKGSGGEPSKFVISRGKTIEDAIINATLTFDRRLYYQHAYVIIIGEEVAKKGIDDYIDMLSRNNEIRENTFLMVAKDSKAYEVMGIGKGVSESPGRYISEIINKSKINSKNRPLEVNKFFKYLYTEGQGYTIGVIEKIEKKGIDKDGNLEVINVLSLEGGSVFKDERLVGYFKGDEMIGFNFIVDELKSATIVFETPKNSIKEKYKTSVKKNYSSVQIFNSKTKLDVELINEKLHLIIDVKLRGNLKAVHEGVDLQNEETLKGLEKAVGKKIEYYIKNTLEKSQKEFEVDTFSIGEVVHRKYPSLWSEVKKEWEDIFKDLDYTINVDSSINEVGFTNSPSSIRKKIYE